jgi:hypothetical protein
MSSLIEEKAVLKRRHQMAVRGVGFRLGLYVGEGRATYAKK